MSGPLYTPHAGYTAACDGCYTATSSDGMSSGVSSNPGNRWQNRMPTRYNPNIGTNMQAVVAGVTRYFGKKK